MPQNSGEMHLRKYETETPTPTVAISVLQLEMIIVNTVNCEILINIIILSS